MNIRSFETNILESFATDAYKASHFLQLPKKTNAVHFYLAPRQPLLIENPKYLFFGIYYFMKKYLSKPITYDDIKHSKKIWNYFNFEGSSYSFPQEGFTKIVEQYNGFLPLTISGVKEGQILEQFNTPILTISNSDPDLVWLPGFIETALLRSIWYPSTVATMSYVIRQYIREGFLKSVDEENYELISSKLHDFGARGASSSETAALGGLAHLINFASTDTMEAVALANYLYDIKIQELASSIPASEHSTVTSWGNKATAEKASLLNLIDQCINRGDKMFSFVSDSYDFYHTIDNIWGDPIIIDNIMKNGLYPVVRPDSGDPTEVVLYALKSLEKSWGYLTNKKGYKVLNRIRIIQGDGMNIEKIQHLIAKLLKYKYSIENITFGMGGGLLQKLDRDSMSWSMKMYKIKIENSYHHVQKNPSTQNSKTSYNPANSVDKEDWVDHYYHDLHLSNPQILKDEFQTIREKAHPTFSSK